MPGMEIRTGVIVIAVGDDTKKLSHNRWHGRLARANVSPCERSAMIKRTGETPVPPQLGL